MSELKKLKERMRKKRTKGATLIEKIINRPRPIIELFTESVKAQRAEMELTKVAVERNIPITPTKGAVKPKRKEPPSYVV